MPAITPQGFHHVAVLVHDVEKVAAFYREILGLPELGRFHHPDGRLRSIWVGASARPGLAGGFFAVEAVEPEAERGRLGFGMVALRIDADERHRVRAALSAHGVTLERETDFTLYLKDPEGNLVGLSHHPSPPPPRPGPGEGAP